MARIKGTNGDDWRVGTFTDDVIWGARGNDLLVGEDGNDRIAGGLGHDRLIGSLGSDRLYGGDGEDQIEDVIDWSNIDRSWVGRDELWGGNGGDYIFGGLGGDLHVGGKGDDYIWMISGIAYGDERGDQRVAGNDTIVTELGLGYGVNRTMVGGRGADTFVINTTDQNPITTRVDIMDFDAADGDRLIIQSEVRSSHIDAFAVFTSLDRDGNWRLDANDGHLGDDPYGNVTQTVEGLQIEWSTAVVVLHGVASVPGDWMIV